MDGSSSIGSLSRATGDEQLVKIQRVGDNKHNQNENKKGNSKKEENSEEKKQNFETVIVDVELAEKKPSAKIAESKAETREAADDKSVKNNSETPGHIDVTG